MTDMTGLILCKIDLTNVFEQCSVSSQSMNSPEMKKVLPLLLLLAPLFRKHVLNHKFMEISPL